MKNIKTFEQFTEEVLEAQKVDEGNAFVYAAAKAKREGKKEFEFNGKTYPVKIKDTNLK